MSPTMVEQKNREEHLAKAVHTAMNKYFKHLNGHKANDLYGMVIGEVERPLLECVLQQVDKNQSRAAEILGISRVTLRKKLKKYDLI